MAPERQLEELVITGEERKLHWKLEKVVHYYADQPTQLAVTVSSK